MYKDLKIAVIGDYMTDYWYEAESIKLCPAFPSLDIVNPKLVSQNPGGAGNVCAAVASLGADVTGFWPKSQEIHHRKRRYMYQDRLVFRVSNHPPVEQGEEVINSDADFTQFDGIIIADYNKGFLTPRMIRNIMNGARKTPVFVDPKFENWECYKGAEILKCNDVEMKTAGTTIEKTAYKYLVRTKSANGMDVTDGHDVWHIPGRGVEAVDVTGAGDMVIAVLALEYLRNGGDILKACHVANMAASLTVQHKRVHYVTVDDLRKEGAWDE